MKLHLPKMLTAALFAAFISFTQASGTTIQDAVLTLTDFTQDSITAANQAGWTLTNVTPNADGIFTSTADQAYITKSTAWTVTSGSGSTARTPWSAILTINVNSLGDSGTGVLIECANNPQQAVGSRLEGIAYDASGNQTLKAAWTGGVWNNLTVTTDLKSYADEDGNVTVGIVYKDGNNGTTIFVGDGDTSVSNSGLRSGNACAGNPTIFLGDKAGVEYSSLYLFGGVVSDNDMKAMLSSLLHGAVTWTGANGAAWDTATQNWVKTGTETPATFSQGAGVTFSADAAVKSVTVGENITAGAMSVSDNYAFTVADGATLTLAGIDVASDKTATFTSQGTISGSITKSGAGTVSITDDGLALSGITVSAGKVVVDGVTAGAVGTITAAAPGTGISVSHATATVQGGYQGDLEIRDGGYVTAATTDGWAYGQTHSLTVYTGGTLDFGTTRWTINPTNTITLAGGTITGVGQGSYGAIDFNGANTLYVTEDSTLAARLRLRADATIDVANGKKLAFTGAFGDKNSKFIKAGQGSMTMSADNSHYTGTIQLDAGTLIVTGANALGSGAIAQNGGVLEIGATVDLGTRLTQTAGSISVLESGDLTLGGLTLANVITNAGALTLTGNYDINALASTGETTYDNGGSSDIAVGNGFQRTTGVVHVVTGGGALNADTATFTHGAEQGTGLNEDGDFVLQGATDYSVLYVNNNNGVSYNAAWELAQSQEPPVAITSVVMANGTKLTADKADASINLTVNGDATVDASAATTIASIGGWSDNTLTITGEGAVTLPTGTLTLTGSTVLVVDGNVNTSKLVIGSQVGDTAALTVNEGASLKVTGDLTPTHGTAVLNGTVNISGSLDLSKSGASDVTLQIGGNGVVTSAGLWMAKTAGIELAEGGSYEVEHLQIVGKAGGASITTTGNNEPYGTGSAAFIISGADITATGNLVLGNKLVNSAVHTGEYTVTLNNTIAVGTGTLGLDGTFAIGGISGTENVSYTGGDNGYKTTSVTRAVYTKDEGGVVTVAPNSTFKVGEEVVDLLADGTATTAGVTNYATYYVNKGTDTVSNALTEHGPTAFRLAESTTLTVDQNVAATVTGTDKTTSLVTIEAPYTLTGTASTVTLGGAGTYALTANTIGLGTNVVLGEDWTGTVLVSGVSGSAGNNLNIDALGRDGSKVEINGFSGYFRQAQDVYAAELVLTGDGMTLVDGFSTLASGDPKPPTSYTFDGGVSGDGDMTFSHKNGSKSNVTQNLYFTGQLSDWTGSLNVVAGFTVNAYFNGQEVNADITHEGGTLNVYVGEGTTFKGGLNASSITVEDGADATLMNMGDEPVDMGNVTIDAGTALSLYKGNTATPEEEATLVIDDGHALTVAALGTLNADLVLNAGSRLDVSGTLGEGLIMGSDVSMWTGDLLAVTTEDGQTTNEAVVDAYLRNYFAQGNEYYTLFTGVDTFSINDVVQTQDLIFTDWLHFDLDAAHLFGNLVENTYAVVYDMDGGIGAGHGTVALKMIPEPTTGTLSLLALMALAARRRRK